MDALKNRLCSIAFVALVALIAAACESFILHQTYQYFGGAALNRPFALTSSGEYLFFIGESLAYDTVFYGTLALLLWQALSRRRRPLLKWHAACFIASLLLIAVFAAAALKLRLFTYFQNSFDLGVLRQLTQGNLANMLIWIDAGQLALLLLVPIAILTSWILSREVGRWLGGGVTVPFTRTASLALVGLWAIVIANHFMIVPWRSLHHGLSSKLSFAAIDLALSQITDFDRDGFGPLTTPSDPDNFNARVHPHALDIPGNGIDENGLAGDLERIDDRIPNGPFRPLPRINGKNVLIIVLETFRAEAVRMELDGKKVMPFMDALSQKHGFTDFAVSNYGVTAQAHQTVLFGTLHYRAGDQTLFSYLRQHGYATFGASAQNEDWGNTYALTEMEKFDGYFDVRHKQWNDADLTPYERMNRQFGLFLDSRELNNKIFEMVDSAADRPFAMFINYQDLHYPYHASHMPLRFIKEARTDAAFFNPGNVTAMKRQYANAAHYLDASLRDLFDGLSARSLMDNTVVVLVGDHPDSFYENGLLGHAWALDESQRRTSLTVVNGVGDYMTPIGQDEIVTIVLNSLDPAMAGRPISFERDPSRRIFVIAGPLEAPRLMGWLSASDLFTFDFKINRLQPRLGGAWIARPEPSDSGEANVDFKALVNRWESLRLLRADKAGEKR